MDIEYNEAWGLFLREIRTHDTGSSCGALLVGLRLQDASHLGGPRVHEAPGREWTHLLRGREAQLERDEELGAAGEGLRLRQRGRSRASPGKTCEKNPIMWENLTYPLV